MRSFKGTIIIFIEDLKPPILSTTLHIFLTLKFAAIHLSVHNFQSMKSPGELYCLFLRILAGKKHRQIRLQRLQKVGLWVFGSLIHQINSS